MENAPINPTDKQIDNKPWLWKKGQSGNVMGRPKGKTMKEYAKQYLERLTDEERDAWLDGIPKDKIWEMSEGKAKQETELSGNLTIAEVIKKLKDGRTRRQTVADGISVQDTQQEQRVSDIPAEQSPAALPTEQMVPEHYTEESSTGIYHG